MDVAAIDADWEWFKLDPGCFALRPNTMPEMRRSLIDYIIRRDKCWYSAKGFVDVFGS